MVGTLCISDEPPTVLLTVTTPATWDSSVGMCPLSMKSTRSAMPSLWAMRRVMRW
ncbi:hypothetical protein D3C81_1859990 [compost metagenome]